jgi:AcrR family transcriptional regulator
MDWDIDYPLTNVNTPCMERSTDKMKGSRMQDRGNLLGPAEWIEAAYAAFETGGIKAVRIEPLSKALGVTRGSFYWHFEDRDALLRAILARWSTEQTERVIEKNETLGGDAREKLLRLLKTCASDDGRLEIGIRDWAVDDNVALHEVGRIDDRRINYMADLAVQAGVPMEEAQDRARVAYIAWLGSYFGVTTATKERRLADMDALFRMMLGH